LEGDFAFVPGFLGDVDFRGVRVGVLVAARDEVVIEEAGHDAGVARFHGRFISGAIGLEGFEPQGAATDGQRRQADGGDRQRLG